MFQPIAADTSTAASNRPRTTENQKSMNASSSDCGSTRNRCSGV